MGMVNILIGINYEKLLVVCNKFISLVGRFVWPEVGANDCEVNKVNRLNVQRNDEFGCLFFLARSWSRQAAAPSQSSFRFFLHRHIRRIPLFVLAKRSLFSFYLDIPVFHLQRSTVAMSIKHFAGVRSHQELVTVLYISFTMAALCLPRKLHRSGLRTRNSAILCTNSDAKLEFYGCSRQQMTERAIALAALSHWRLIKSICKWEFKPFSSIATHTHTEFSTRNGQTPAGWFNMFNYFRNTIANIDKRDRLNRIVHIFTANNVSILLIEKFLFSNAHKRVQQKPREIDAIAAIRRSTQNTEHISEITLDSAVAEWPPQGIFKKKIADKNNNTDDNRMACESILSNMIYHTNVAENW